MKILYTDPYFIKCMLNEVFIGAITIMHSHSRTQNVESEMDHLFNTTKGSIFLD